MKATMWWKATKIPSFTNADTALHAMHWWRDCVSLCQGVGEEGQTLSASRYPSCLYEYLFDMARRIRPVLAAQRQDLSCSCGYVCRTFPFDQSHTCTTVSRTLHYQAPKHTVSANSRFRKS